MLRQKRATGLFARFLGATLAGSMLCAVPAFAQDKPLTPLVWGVDSFLTTLPQRIAEEFGWFKEEGVSMTLRVSALGAESMDQIIAGEADVA
ncbi:hypothetical protein DY251_21180 [Mesorhizobium denitrificans]|uniref:ABC transporter substrate-binding protein n=2 Tax=Mesorhizobium denitrificans TaxID=2294114 RepID=A0A371X1U8_9HYPH|nr:hypothetical protein DY251_21180 [Mesorhizobium denitrificans]